MLSPNSRLLNEKPVGFHAVEEAAKKKIVRFEGIQDETVTVTDKDKNTTRHQKQKRKQDKSRRRRLRKLKIAMQRREEASEEMDGFSWTCFVECYTDENEDNKFREIVANWKNEYGGLEAAIVVGRNYESLDDGEKDRFKALRKLLISEGKCCVFHRHLLLARSREFPKIDGAEVDQDGTNDASSIAYSKDSDALNRRDVRIPPGMEEGGVLDHRFTSVQIKQEMKETMSSVLNKDEKRKALEVWLREVEHSSISVPEWNQHSFHEFRAYVTGEEFNPNDIVEVFKSRQKNSAIDSVDGSSNGTVASDSTISSDGLVGFHVNLGDNDNNNN